MDSPAAEAKTRAAVISGDYTWILLLTLVDAAARQRSATLEYCGQAPGPFSYWTLIRMSPVVSFFDVCLELGDLIKHYFGRSNTPPRSFVGAFKTIKTLPKEANKSTLWPLESILLLIDTVPSFVLVFAATPSFLGQLCAMIYLMALLVHMAHHFLVGTRFAEADDAERKSTLLFQTHLVLYSALAASIWAHYSVSIVTVLAIILQTVLLSGNTLPAALRQTFFILIWPAALQRWRDPNVVAIGIQVYRLVNNLDFGWVAQQDGERLLKMIRNMVIATIIGATPSWIVVVLMLVVSAFVFRRRHRRALKHDSAKAEHNTIASEGDVNAAIATQVDESRLASEEQSSAS